MGVVSSPCLEEDEVLAFVAGDLASHRRREVLDHVDGCETCRVLAAEIARDQSGEGPGDEAEMDDEAPASASNLEIGQLVSERFRLGEVLGRGAMGTVFRARDETLGTDVALKLLRRGVAGASSGYMKELRVGRRITHPNVCRLYDAGSTEHFDYITMELLDGETLAAILARADLPRPRAVALLVDIAAGLAAAHAQGVVHRDLKPANVMIVRGGRAVLTDFGLAADLEGKQSRRLVGTPAYWSPEQARGEPPTPASDVYSFGVLAYRLLTGSDFSLSDGGALDDVPRELRRVVAKCMSLRPGERYRDAAEAGCALASAAERRGSRRWVAPLVVVATVMGIAAWASAHRTPAAAPATGGGSVGAASAAAAPVESAAPAASVPVGRAPSAAHVDPPATKSTVAEATAGPIGHPPIVRAPSVVRPAPSAPASPSASSFGPAPADSGLLYRK